MDLSSIRESFGSFARPPQDDGRITPDSVLREMGRFCLPAVQGGLAAVLTLSCYPPMAHAISLALERRPHFSEFRQLVWGVNVSIFGDTAHVEHMRKEAREPHEKLFGALDDRTQWRATEPEVLRTVYIVLTYLLMRSQEKLYRPLSTEEADAYVADAAETVGYTFALEAGSLPRSGGTLAAQYAHIVATKLTPSSQTSPVCRAMLGQELGGMPMEALASMSSWLLPPNVAAWLGIECGSEPSRKIVPGHWGSDDLLPMAVQFLEANSARDGQDPHSAW
jgi:uncharacterized protein (DUF2236 family)